MLDLHSHPNSPVTLGRSFASDPQKVSRLGAAFARGLAKEAILACTKHFPGHGDATVDPHLDLPIFRGDLKRLMSTELVPFMELISAEVPMIMTAHIFLPEIDADFAGVILADDLAMGAIAKVRAPAESAVLTFQAGSDMALICHDWNLVAPTIERLSSARNRREFDQDEWEASHRRIERLRQKLSSEKEPIPALDVVGCAEHRAIVEKIRTQLNRKLTRS